MCGIAGYYLRAGVVLTEPLSRAAKSLQHRGPDGSGYFEEKSVGLVHTRLSIIDLDGGAQPLFSEGRQKVLVGNGEIYNYLELRSELESLGYHCQTHSDSEVAIPAWQHFGDRFPEKLIGMFALALYERDSGRMLLVRDRLGIKPLFLLSDPRGVFFASEIKAIFAMTRDSVSVNPRGLVQYMQNNFTSGETTLFDGIERVLPGEAVLIEDGVVVRRWQYWQPQADEQVRRLSLDDATEHFDALMREVMAIHLRSDVPFGLYLSGGVDSSVLLAMLRELNDGRPTTYSVGFPGSSVINELDDAAKMARLFDTDHHVLALDQNALLGMLPQAIWSADELMGDYANLPVALLSRKASERLKVVFSGEGGDEVFAGYARYRQLPAKYWMKSLQYPGSGGFRMSKSCKRGLEQSLFGTAMLDERHAWSDPFRQAWQKSAALQNRLSRMQTVDIRTWLADDLLVKADRMMMAFGIEGRLPFLDHRIVEFGLSLSPAAKIEGKTGKAFLRRWAERYVPKDHLWSKKRGFTVPVRDWLHGDTLVHLEQLLLAQAGVKHWFNSIGVQALVKRQQRNGDVTPLLWRLWQFALWHQIFVEGKGQRPEEVACPYHYLREAT